MDLLKRIIYYSTLHNYNYTSFIDILLIFINRTFDFKKIMPLICVNKQLNNIISEYKHDLFKIPYISQYQDYTDRQKLLIENNTTFFQFHSSWFISLVRHNSVDLVKKYHNLDFYSRKMCKDLHCPPLCSGRLDLYDNIALLCKDICIDLITRKEILENITVSELDYFLPLIVLNNDLPDNLINEASNKLIYEIWPILIYIKQSKQSGPIKNKVSKQIISQIAYACSCARTIILEPEIEISNAYQIMIPLIKILTSNYSSTYNTAKCELTKMKVVMTTESALKLSVKSSEWNTKEYLIFTTNFYSIYVISKCLTFLSTVPGMRIAAPYTTLGDSGAAILELPEGSTLDQDVLTTYHPGKSVDWFSAYTATNYLLGLGDKYIGASDKGIFSLDFSNLYNKDRIRLGSIIKVLGGRSNPLYIQFIIMTIANLMALRKYYKVVVMFTDCIYIKRELVEARFKPSLTDEEAKTFFENKLARDGDFAVRGWKYLGY